MYVYIKEELDKPDLIDYTKPVPVISDYDAIVTRVVVLTGTAAVKNGDTVLKGQTLIYPYLTNKKENEETEEIRVDIRATGMVYGRVWYKESFVLSDETIITKRTGKYKEYVTPSYIFKGGLGRISRMKDTRRSKNRVFQRGFSAQSYIYEILRTGGLCRKDGYNQAKRFAGLGGLY